jgi:hypothetical protein
MGSNIKQQEIFIFYSGIPELQFWSDPWHHELGYFAMIRGTNGGPSLLQFVTLYSA